VYEVAAKDASNTEIGRATCITATPEPSSVVCWWVDTGTGFDVSWDLYAGADKYVIYRSVDGAGPYWRGAVDDPGVLFACDAYPSQGGSVVYEVAARDASNTEIGRGPCLEGERPFYCEAAAVPAGQIVGLRDLVVNAVSYDVERSNAPGVWLVIESLDEANNEMEDTNPGVSPSYRLMARDAGGAALAVFDCEATTLDPGADQAAYDPPTAPSGAIGGSGPGAGETPALEYLNNEPVTPAPNSPNTPVTAESLCSANGLYRALPAQNQTSVWASLIVPAGGEVIIDIANRKNGLTRGNWAAAARMYQRNANGTAGAQIESFSFAPPYRWTQVEYRYNDRSLGTNNGPTGEFLIELRQFNDISIAASEGARYLVDNVRIVDADGEVTSRPCDLVDIRECQESGNLLFTEGQTIDGTSYGRGCYTYQSCFSDLPSVAGVLNDLSEWACENDDFLEKALVAGVVIVIVLGVVVLAAAPAAAAAAGTVLYSGLAVASLPATIAGIPTNIFLIGVAAAGLLALAAWPSDLDVPPDFLDRYVGDPIKVEELNGELVISGDTLVKQIAANVAMDAIIDALADPENEDEARNIAERAIETCVAEMADPTLQAQVIANYVPAGAVQDGATVTVNGEDQHLCEFIPIYIPGAGTWAKGFPMREATVHISQVVNGTPGVNEALYPGTPSQTNPELDPPQAQWIVLNRQKPPNDRKWRTDPMKPYKCKGMFRVSDCDEWPAAATTQGGEPGAGVVQPHLSIMHWRHNRRGGSDLNSFYDGCGVEDKDVFLAIPMPPAMLGQFNITDKVPRGQRSLRICP